MTPFAKQQSYEVSEVMGVPVNHPFESMGISGSSSGGTVPYKAIFWGYIPLHRPYIGLIYGRYLQSIGSCNGH